MATRQPNDRRNKALAAIHIAMKQLGLDRETYEQMLWTLARVKSSRDLDEHGRRAVIEHLKARGFKDRSRPQPGMDRAPLVKKIKAMLIATNRPNEYADGMSRHMFHVDRFEWCNPEQLRKLVAALTYDAQRQAKKTDAPK